MPLKQITLYLLASVALQLTPNLLPLLQVEQCDASVSYDTQLLVAHFSPLDLKIATFLGSNFMHGSQLVKKNQLTLKINLVKPQLFHVSGFGIQNHNWKYSSLVTVWSVFKQNHVRIGHLWITRATHCRACQSSRVCGVCRNCYVTWFPFLTWYHLHTVLSFPLFINYSSLYPPPKLQVCVRNFKGNSWMDMLGSPCGKSERWSRLPEPARVWPPPPRLFKYLLTHLSGGWKDVVFILLYVQSW